ncbi:MAG: TIGR00153 family protein [Bacteroidetes bacterium]|nr:TIGR00153 family protein [Bacteroidota bacterium]
MLGTNPLGRLFGPNPFSLLKQHMRLAKDCAEQLPALFGAILEGNSEEIARLQGEIDRLENEADQVHKTVRQHLPRTFMLPVDRRDLLDLLEMQDKIANVTQDIAGLLVERQMQIPSGISEPLMPFVRECVGVVRLTATIMEEMDELLETGFSGPEARKVSEMIDRLNDAEQESDNTGAAVSRALFAHEDQINPVSVIFWYRLLEWIGDTADYAEAVGNRLRLMIAQR